MKILIVGGGTSGLISALILKTFLNAQVDVVYSKDIGIVGVGEGSTEHFNDFMRFVGIDYLSVLKECDATFKSGILFQNWSNKTYLHNVADPFSNLYAQYPYVYAKLITSNSNHIVPNYLYKNKLDAEYLKHSDRSPFNQYHFNTYKLNDFLQKLSKERGISFFDDEIKNIHFKESGDIDYLTGNNKIYSYDFYIDSTGFKKLLISNMGTKWISFSKYLKMKSAVVFPTPDEDEYNIWTLSKAMDYGWRFKIPTWGRHGNGYIFDSDYISADQAKEELDKELGIDVDIKKEFKFDPGHLDRVWVKNCVAIGLSGSFVEPLEATSIGTSIQQSFLLMHRILNYNDKTIKNYNDTFTNIMNNIRDFIVLHYIVDKNNSKFWQDIKKIDLPDSLKSNLEKWTHSMPIAEDFKDASHYNLFWGNNFTLILDGLNLFNLKSISKEYESLSPSIKNIADNTIKNNDFNQSNLKLVGHKQFIYFMREVFN
jgi:hypothetical protein